MTTHGSNRPKLNKLAVAMAACMATSLSLPVAFAAEGDDDAPEKITVTGSRIKRVDIEGAAPVTVIDRDEITRSGVTSIGKLLQELPSIAGAGTNNQVNNGGSGSVRLSLRGIGTARTLILVNGRRMVFGGLGANASVDLNTIPVETIERIEVLKDGASAIYGSDAIAGVVNIITRSDFEGLEVSAYGARSSRNDGDTEQLTMTFGKAFDRGNFVFSASYLSSDSISAADRGFSKTPYLSCYGDKFFFGSSRTPQGAHSTSNGFLILKKGASGTSVDDFRPFNFGFDFANEKCSSDNDSYNFSPVNNLTSPQERKNIYFEGKYDLFDKLGMLENVTFFTETLFQNRQSNTVLAPLPFDGRAPFDDVLSSGSNFFNPFGEDVATRRRMVETGGRKFTQNVNTFRFVAGLEGELSNGWSWDLAFNWGQNRSIEGSDGQFVRSLLAQALGPSFQDANGDIVCGTPGNVIEGCVPMNIFGGPGSITQETLTFVGANATLHFRGINEQKQFTFNLTGDLFELPAGPVGFAIGYEFREERGADIKDPLSVLGLITGNQGQNTKGAFDIDEVYLEFQAPIVSDLPFAKMVMFDVGIRFSDFSNFGYTDNIKVGLNWDIMEGLKVRGTWSEVFRAPGVSALFAGQSDNAPSVNDPCAGTDFSTLPATDPLRVNCLAQGVPLAGFTQTDSQVASRRGGNPDLLPEEGIIFTAGVVYSPTFHPWLEGLSFTADYWNLQLEDTISSIGEQTRLVECANNGLFCDTITRQANGEIFEILDFLDNIGTLDAAGADFNVRYSLSDTPFGSFVANMDWSYMDKWDIKTLPSAPQIHNAGVFLDSAFGGDGNFARWRGNFDLAWSKGDAQASWTVRFIGEVVEQNFDSFQTGLNRTIEAVVYHDINIAYHFSDWDTRVEFGVDNLFDESPPLTFNGFNNTTDLRTYDGIGSFGYARIVKRF